MGIGTGPGCSSDSQLVEFDAIGDRNISSQLKSFVPGHGFVR